MNGTTPACMTVALWASKSLPQKALATLIASAFVLKAWPDLGDWLQAMLAEPPFRAALWQSLLAAMATSLGAAALWTIHRPTPRELGIAMAIAAGAMLFVVTHELLPEAARTLASKRAGGYLAGGFVTMTAASQLV